MIYARTVTTTIIIAPCGTQCIMTQDSAVTLSSVSPWARTGGKGEDRGKSRARTKSFFFFFFLGGGGESRDRIN